jgi:hypothetical protein
MGLLWLAIFGQFLVVISIYGEFLMAISGSWAVSGCDYIAVHVSAEGVGFYGGAVLAPPAIFYNLFLLHFCMVSLVVIFDPKPWLQGFCCIHTYMTKSIHTYLHIHSTYTIIHIHTYTYIHIHIHTYTYIHIHIHTYTYIYIHIHTYTYIYIHIHTYIA